MTDYEKEQLEEEMETLKRNMNYNNGVEEGMGLVLSVLPPDVKVDKGFLFCNDNGQLGRDIAKIQNRLFENEETEKIWAKIKEIEKQIAQIKDSLK